MAKRWWLFIEIAGEVLIGGIGVAAVFYWKLPPLVTTLAVVALIAMFWWMFEQKRRLIAERIRVGQCVKCGYDMRSTPEICRQCGHRPRLKPVSPTKRRSRKPVVRIDRPAGTRSDANPED